MMIPVAGPEQWTQKTGVSMTGVWGRSWLFAVYFSGFKVTLLSAPQEGGKDVKSVG
jgi:hypothetical protein